MVTTSAAVEEYPEESSESSIGIGSGNGNGGALVLQPYTAASGTPSSSSSPSKQEKGNASFPTRGVNKVPSLRRGAAGYAQLLQSAVMASIEAGAIMRQDGNFDYCDMGDAIPLRPAPHEDANANASSTSLEQSSASSLSCSSPSNSGKRRFQDHLDVLPQMPRRCQSQRFRYSMNDDGDDSCLCNRCQGDAAAAAAGKDDMDLS